MWVYEEWREEEYSGYVALEVGASERLMLDYLRKQQPAATVQQHSDSFWGDMYVAIDPDEEDRIVARVRRVPVVS